MTKNFGLLGAKVKLDSPLWMQLSDSWRKSAGRWDLIIVIIRKVLIQHNRMRMLTGCVLTKYFMVDWRKGMKFFYQNLVDADVFNNTAGWGWVSSTGPDAVPYFRPPFNPWIQSKKFDLVNFQSRCCWLKITSGGKVHQTICSRISGGSGSGSS